jgi:sugar lactone lactonase YvrE
MAELRRLLGGISFGESPRWGGDGRLWLADWGRQQIIAVDLDGRSEVIAKLNLGAFQPICIDWLDDRLLVVSARAGQLLRREPDGTLVTHADLSELTGGGLWNEVVVDGRGNTYLNNIGFDFPAGAQFTPGTIALLTRDGVLRQVAEGVAFPNGMAVAADNSTLICAESYGKCLTAFDIAADGSLSNQRVWADLGEGVPDGICIDSDGAVWHADVPNKRCVRVEEGGQVVQTIDANVGCFSCALGGMDRATLFVVAREWRGPESMADPTPSGQVLAAEAPARGACWP